MVKWSNSQSADGSGAKLAALADDGLEAAAEELGPGTDSVGRVSLV